MAANGRPYNAMGVMRQILKDNPELTTSTFRKAYADELEKLGYSNGDLPSDLTRMYYSVRAEIRDGKEVPIVITRGNKPPAIPTEPAVPQQSQRAPFSAEMLAYIFTPVSPGSDKLKIRENDWLEFKENFTNAARADYVRAMAAFANSKGGYLVFGVDDTCSAKGMASKDLPDPRKLTQYLGTKVSQTLEWSSCIHTLGERVFGLIYTKESRYKPVVAIADDSDNKDGDIYYRYSGESKRIKSSDLLRILAERFQAQDDKWHEMLKQMATITPQNADILDLATGRIGNTPILIDQNALEQIKFIKEGELNEIKGDPTLKLIGEVKGPAGAVVVSKDKSVSIDAERVILSVLEQDCDAPLEYLRHLTHHSMTIVPIWFFVDCAKITPSEAVELLQGYEKCNKHTRNKIVSRLRDGEYLSYYRGASKTVNSLEVGTWNLTTFDSDVQRIIQAKGLQQNQKYSVGRVLVATALTNDDLSVMGKDFVSNHIRQVLEAVALLEPSVLKKHAEQLLDCLKFIVGASAWDDISDKLRRAVCYVDAVLYAPEALLRDEE